MSEVPTQVVPPVVAPVVMTRAEKLDVQIEKLRVEIDTKKEKFVELCSLRESIDLLEGIGEGSVLTVKIGRAETAKNVNGTVVGVKSEEDGARKFKVYYGEGIDADLVVVNESQIVKVISNPAPAA
jgi:hypothetical protein